MRDDTIARIEIDEHGRLCIWPSSERFDLIYRSAAEVHWDQSGNYLYSPKPREWSYLDWFSQIVAIALDEYGVRLKTNSQTDWTNLQFDLKSEIERAQNTY